MSLEDCREGLKLRLETIKGLNVYKQPPDAAPKLPAVIMQGLDRSPYDQSAGGLVLWSMPLLLLLVERESESAWKELDEYCEKTGDKSIKAAAEGGSVGDFAWVSFCDFAGHIVHRGTTFIGAQFTCQVADS